MIYFIIGFFTGGLVSLVMYSTVVSKRISDLVYTNERLMSEVEKKKEPKGLQEGEDGKEEICYD